MRYRVRIRGRPRTLLAAAALALLGLMSSLPSYGLSCDRLSEEESLALVREAALIFHGKIVSVSERPDSSGTNATARILELHKGEPGGDFVSFRTPLGIGSSDVPWIGLEIREGDRGLVILNESDGSFVQTNIACQIPWQEHMDELRHE